MQISYSDMALVLEKGKQTWKSFPSIAEIVEFIKVRVAELNGDEVYPDAKTLEVWKRERASEAAFRVFKAKYLQLLESWTSEKQINFTGAMVLLSELNAREERLGLQGKACNEVSDQGYATVPRVNPETGEITWEPAPGSWDYTGIKVFDRARKEFKKKKRAAA